MHVRYHAQSMRAAHLVRPKVHAWNDARRPLCHLMLLTATRRQILMASSSPLTVPTVLLTATRLHLLHVHVLMAKSLSSLGLAT